jgi:transcriptional regulator with XRE-family HTH domain
MTTPNQDAGQVFLKREAFNRIARTHNCESDSACARLTGTHRSTISRLRAQIGSPSGAVMLQIAESLGVDVEVLFTRNREES